MAYDKNNLVRLPGAPFAGIWGLWLYRSADTFTTFKAANYISNAFEMGVKARDVVIVVDLTGPATTLSNVLTVTATTCTTSQTGVVIAE